MNCFYCGKITKNNTSYCNINCENKYTEQFNKNSKPLFRTFQEAAKFYKRDFRTMKKFENILFTIDKSIPSISTKWINCRNCGEQSPKSKARSGFCRSCTNQGIGKKYQGKVISKKYKGSKNPNYIHGKSKNSELQDNKWYKLKKELNFKKCFLTNTTRDIDYHHIIPRWFCKLSNIDIFDHNNIIGLNHKYHKAVHHLQLDILLLPNLYFLYKKDALQLRSEFLNLLLLHKVHQYPVEQLEELHLFQISRLPSKKKLLNLLPEFLPPFLDHKV